MQTIELNTLDWNLLRAFACVVEMGSLTKAASQLGLSQPTLSRQIATLEEQVGAPLFDRTGRRLRPTEMAQTLQDCAQRMHDAVQALGSLSQTPRDTLSGTVRISTNEVIAAYVLPAVLARLAQQHPDIEIELVTSQHTDSEPERAVDLAVRMGRPSQDAVISRYLGDWPLGLYAHRNYLTQIGGDIDPTRLHDYRWIGLDRNTQLVEGFRSAGHNIDRHFFGLRSDNMIVGLQAVRAGLGIGLLNQPVASTDPDLVQVLPEQALPSMPVWLMAHRELRGTRRLRVVFDFLADELQAIGNCHPAEPAPAELVQRPSFNFTSGGGALIHGR